MGSKSWAVVGTLATAQRIVVSCERLGILAEAYPAVVALVNPKIRGELEAIGPLDTSVFTSRTAAELVYEHAPTKLRAEIAGSKAYAIGPSTASRVRELFGVEPAIPTSYTSEGLITLVAGRKLGRTALFSSTARSGTLASKLKELSSFFAEPKLYELAVDHAVAHRFLEGFVGERFGGVVLTCSTAAEILRGTRPTAKTRLIAMGPRTLDTLRLAGHQALTPTKSSVEGVVRLIAELEGL